jgi:hypothetical protein
MLCIPSYLLRKYQDLLLLKRSCFPGVLSLLQTYEKQNSDPPMKARGGKYSSVGRKRKLKGKTKLPPARKLRTVLEEL